jgi:hypothetical protein
VKSANINDFALSIVARENLLSRSNPKSAKFVF